MSTTSEKYLIILNYITERLQQNDMSEKVKSFYEEELKRVEHLHWLYKINEDCDAVDTFFTMLEMDQDFCPEEEDVKYMKELRDDLKSRVEKMSEEDYRVLDWVEIDD